MKILLGIACVLLIACTRARAPTVTIREARTGAPTVAIRAVTVVDVMDGSLRDKQTVLVAGNRITAVGPADKSGYRTMRTWSTATGGFLIPGLWDMHVHSVANVTWDMDVRSIGNAEWHFPLFLAYGVTGVRNMNDATADPTLELTRSVKRRLADGRLRGPRLLANGPSVDGDPPLTSNPVVVRTAAEARAVVDTLADHGADFVKVYTNLSREAYFAIMDQARQRGIHVDGHVPFRVLPVEAADAGQRTFEHLLAMALGCSTEADSERKAFARVLSDPGRSSDGRTEPAGALPARAPSLRDAKSGRLHGDDPGVQEKRRGRGSLPGRVPPRRQRERDPVGRSEPATRSPGCSPQLGGKARLRDGPDSPLDPRPPGSRYRWRTRACCTRRESCCWRRRT